MSQIPLLSTPHTNLVTAAAKNSQPANIEAIDRSAHQFEAMFVTEMLKPMMETVDVDSTFGGGKGEEIFRGFMTEEYGKLIAGRGIGLASSVKEALLRAQEGSQQSSTRSAP